MLPFSVLAESSTAVIEAISTWSDLRAEEQHEKLGELATRYLTFSKVAAMALSFNLAATIAAKRLFAERTDDPMDDSDARARLARLRPARKKALVEIPKEGGTRTLHTAF